VPVPHLSVRDNPCYAPPPAELSSLASVLGIEGLLQAGRQPPESPFFIVMPYRPLRQLIIYNSACANYGANYRKRKFHRQLNTCCGEAVTSGAAP
jgi:hypothetical protein